MNIFDVIQHRDRVTIMTPHGSRLTGSATIRNENAGVWVLNLGGKYGTPGIASESNIIQIRRAGKLIYGNK